MEKLFLMLSLKIKLMKNYQNKDFNCKKYTYKGSIPFPNNTQRIVREKKNMDFDLGGLGAVASNI